MFEFKLPDMTCGHCASTITRALKQADPACEVHIDLPTQQVQVKSAEERSVLAEALFDAAGVAYQREIGSGEPAPALIEMAERHGCDAIILGARGLGALRSALMGSVSQGILHASRLPVTVVKHTDAGSAGA